MGNDAVEVRKVKVSDSVVIGAGDSLALLGGPCVIESESLCMIVAEKLKRITQKLKVPFVFKASFDKANRSALDGFRGPGLEEGLKVLEKVKKEFDLPVVSDVHEASQVSACADVLDIIQIPAFLCRQTDLLVAAANSGKPVNVKKGQFLAPWDVLNIINKLTGSGCSNLMLTERGTSFGYNQLVTDFRSLVIMRSYGYPVIFDGTHSVQMPGGKGTSSGGDSSFVPHLLKAAVAVGCDAVFLEIHPEPSKALSDGSNMLPLGEIEDILKKLLSLKEALR